MRKALSGSHVELRCVLALRMRAGVERCGDVCLTGAIAGWGVWVWGGLVADSLMR